MTHIVERAFELADSGDYFTFVEAARRLVQEGYSQAEVHGYLSGPSLRAQLQTRMRAARSL